MDLFLWWSFILCMNILNFDFTLSPFSQMWGPVLKGSSGSSALGPLRIYTTTLVPSVLFCLFYAPTIGVGETQSGFSSCSNGLTVISNECLRTILEFSCFHVHQRLYCFLCFFLHKHWYCWDPVGVSGLSLTACVVRIMAIQAYLRDIEGSVPVHHNKANISVSRVREFFDFPVHMKLMFTSYCSLLSVQ